MQFRITNNPIFVIIDPFNRYYRWLSTNVKGIVKLLVEL